MKQATPNINNESGFISLDFIFGTLIFGIFVSVFIGIAMMFSVVEVVQYATFSSARSYSLAHLDTQAQQNLGETKFGALTSTGILRALLTNGWFELGSLELGDFNNELASDDDLSSDAAVFVGARVDFNAPILFKRYPLMGQTGEDRDSFLAKVQSFLGREPTQDECNQFNQERINAIESQYPDTDPSAYSIQADNGC